MKCIYCGEELPERSNFCPLCGRENPRGESLTEVTEKVILEDASVEIVPSEMEIPEEPMEALVAEAQIFDLHHCLFPPLNSR